MREREREIISGKKNKSRKMGKRKKTQSERRK